MGRIGSLCHGKEVFDLFNSVLSKVFESVKDDKMPLLPHLFRLWSFGGGKVWRDQRGRFGDVAHLALQSFFKRGI